MLGRLNIVRKLMRAHIIEYSTKAATAQNRVPLITCKQTKFNLFLDKSGETKSKEPSDDILLASKGWQDHKAKGDHFTIHSRKDIAAVFKDAVNFSELSLHEQLLKNLDAKHNIQKATKLQRDAFQQIMQRNHVLLAAETGCGKTHAYLLPIIQQLIETKAQETNARNFNTPLALILTPSRELAEQIARVAEELTDGLGLTVKAVIGGNTKKHMMNPHFDEVDILVGSIGAVSKLTTTAVFRMKEVKHVVLDEADTLLDDSFNPQLCYYLRRFAFYRDVQLILASATMPTNTDDVFQDIIDTQTLNKVVSNDLHMILPYVTQKFMRTNKMDRSEYLLKIVRTETQKRRPVIVFSNKSATCDYIDIFLNNNGINCINVNGDMLRVIREGRFNKFQDGEVNVLSATDSIGRGLNTLRARHIINFEFPMHISDYIHRCGRIGRLGSDKNCYITNFISGLHELDLVRKIELSARSNYLLKDVNANIRQIITDKIKKEIEKHENMELKQMASNK